MFDKYVYELNIVIIINVFKLFLDKRKYCVNFCDKMVLKLNFLYECLMKFYSFNWIFRLFSGNFLIGVWNRYVTDMF